MWIQVAGKVRLALEPMLNHWWQVPLYVSSRGLTTSLMHQGAIDLEMEFDLNDHLLEIRTCGGEFRQVELKPRSVADLYAATMTALQELGVTVKLLARPVEVPEAIPFAKTPSIVLMTLLRRTASGWPSGTPIASWRASAPDSAARPAPSTSSGEASTSP